MLSLLQLDLLTITGVLIGIGSTWFVPSIFRNVSTPEARGRALVLYLTLNVIGASIAGLGVRLMNVQFPLHLF